jgi:hypothetical protein
LRLWSLHPKYLDSKGLLALWRESLLAQKVLQGKTMGYRNHPQLDRFKAHPYPQKAIGRYLLAVWHEANQRKYSFDKKKVKNAGEKTTPILVTDGQIEYEWKHLRKKLRNRDQKNLKKISMIKNPDLNSSFRRIKGSIEPWEKI